MVHNSLLQVWLHAAETVISLTGCLLMFFLSAGADFNNTVIERTFLAAETSLMIELSGMLIVDDDINEPIEGFVMVLEVESNDPLVELLDGFDAIRFDILDNDGKPLTHGKPLRHSVHNNYYFQSDIHV